VKQQLEEADIPVWVGLGNRPEVIKSLNFAPATKKEQGGGKRHMSEKKVQIRVKVVPYNAFQLQEFCVAFSDEMGNAKFVYHGESMPVVYMRALSYLCTSRRLSPPKAVKDAILEKQKGKCKICGDKLDDHCEFDHISPLCRGGTNDVSNLRALCTMCHAEETDRLLQDGVDKTRFHTIESHMSPQLREQLHCAPKPKEVSYGVFEEKKLQRAVAPKTRDPEKLEKRKVAIQKLLGRIWKGAKNKNKAKNVRDLLVKHPKPQAARTEKLVIPPGVSELKCMDAKGCRVLALTKRTRGLPVFCPLDEWEPFVVADLSAYDFVFVDLEAHAKDAFADEMFAFLGELEETEAIRAQILKDLEVEDGESVDEELLPPLPEEPVQPQAYCHEGLFPYTGARWYAAEVCEHLLEKQLIPAGACRAGLRATRHIPSAVLAEHFQKLDTVAERINFDGNERLCNAFKKQGILSMIGIWNSTSQHSWKQVRSKYEVDAGHGLKQRRRMDDGSFLWTTSNEIIDLYSMAPWGRIALDVEQLRIAQAKEALALHPEITEAGAHVDGVFFLCYSLDSLQIYCALESQFCFPDGSPIFHLKDEPVCKVPKWKQPDPIRSQKLEFVKHVWRVEQEGDKGQHADLTLMVEQIVEWIAEHKGCLLSGPAGTGKSTLLKALLGNLKEKLPGKQIVMALRHCSAMLVQGKTIQHFLFKYRSKGGAPAPGSIVIIDEWSEVQLHTWVELARWKLVGVIFILVGDADGQRKPSFDRWQDAMQAKDIRESRLIWDICGGLRLNLTKNRRSSSDVDLFRRFTAMYKHADVNEKLPSYVQRGLADYRYDESRGACCDHYFVVSHKHRMDLNRLVNHHLAEQHKPVCFLEGTGKLHGVTMQPQGMILWHGIELLCCSRRYRKNSPVSGAVYVVQSWNHKTVTVKLHEAYRGEKVTADDEEPDEELPIDEESDEESEAETDSEALEEDAPGKTTDQRSGDVYVLTLARCAELLRPQHALVYASIQGRTMRDKHIALMDLGHQHMTMRDLITAMSRPTHGQFLHFVSEQQQAKLLGLCAGLTDEDLRKRAVEINTRPESDRPDPSPVGR